MICLEEGRSGSTHRIYFYTGSALLHYVIHIRVSFLAVRTGGLDAEVHDEALTDDVDDNLLHDTHVYMLMLYSIDTV